MSSPRFATVPDELVGLRHGTLQTTGRVTGRRHTAQLWFVPADGGVYLYSGSGGLVSWCLNLQVEEEAVFTIADRSWLARAAFLQVGDARRDEALERFAAEYGQPQRDADGRWPEQPAVAHLVFTRAL